MARILTGIQSTGTPHLGNILGAIIACNRNGKRHKNESYLFIADMHSLTQIKDAELHFVKTPTLLLQLGWLLG